METFHKEFANGRNIKYQLPNGMLHREDGPAKIVQGDRGYKLWAINGRWHKLDGPALVYNNGRTSWYVNGRCIHHEIHEWSDQVGIDLDNLSEDDKIIIAMKWSEYGK